MRKYILLIIILGLTNLAIGQILNQDAQGKSSIVVPGGSLNFDIKDGLFKGSYYRNSKKYDPKGWTFGLDLQGKNTEGIVSLFQNGDFSPDGEASILIGRHNAKQYKKGTTRSLFYLRIGLVASQFKLDKGITYTSTSTRFVDTLHVGPKVELGSTWRVGGHWYFGLLLGNVYQNNQANLIKTTYKYTVNDPTITGLQNSKDITAYSGNYGLYYNTFINFDALYFIPSEDTEGTSTYYVCPNFYFRYNTSNNKSLMNNNGVAGFSLNFITIEAAKFLGGVYVQTNDLFKEQTQQFDKTIQFGLVARFSISSITSL